MTPLRLLSCAVAVVAGVLWLSATSANAGPSAQVLYQRDCAICHGAAGDGTRLGPSLRNAGRAALHYYVSTGRMPLLKTARTDSRGRPRVPAPGHFAVDADMRPQRRTPPYTPRQIRELVDYASALTGPGPDVTGVDLGAGNVPRGGELFRLNCAACHSWAGEGGALLHREAPSLARSTALQAAEAVRVGPGEMPAFGAAALDDQQLADVVAYVEELQHARDPGGSALWHLGPVAEGAVALIIGMGAIVTFLRWIGERG
jgi:ubiquinol-cytochrome c reductase cytochrome c subunit